MWAKASISPLFELAREVGEAQPVGKADRPHIHRHCASYTCRGVRAMALMLALLVVENQPSPDAGLSRSDVAIGMQVNLLVFEAAPQPLDEDVVHAAPLAIHANRDLVPPQHAGEVVAGKLAALVGVEDLRPTKASERFLERLDAEIGAECVRQPPGQYCTTVPVHDRD